MPSFRPGALAALTVSLASISAHAHISLNEPKSRFWNSSDMEAPANSPQKQPPCGQTGSTRTTNPALITTYAPGQRITVQWHETIHHPGHYRIAFVENGQEFPAPTLMPATNPTGAILADGIMDKPGNGSYTQEITLPDVECTNCTLQLIQVMSDSRTYYYQCADLILSRSAGGGTGGAGGSGGPGGAGGSTGGTAPSNAGSGGMSPAGAGAGAMAGGGGATSGAGGMLGSSGTAGSVALGGAAGMSSSPGGATGAGTGGASVAGTAGAPGVGGMLTGNAGAGLGGSLATAGSAGAPPPASAGTSTAGSGSSGPPSAEEASCSMRRAGRGGSSLALLAAVLGYAVARTRRRVRRAPQR